MTKFYISLLLVLSQLSFGQMVIVPQPAKIIASDDVFVLQAETGFSISGTVNEHTLRAIQRLREGLRYRTSMPLNSKTLTNEKANNGICIHAEQASKLFPGMDESYSIKVSPTGIAIHSETTVGALRAVETVLQLLEKRDSLWVIPSLSIQDEPMLAYRGLMLDPARRFLSIDALKRTIRAMAAVKLNALHLHLSDDQGWRLESKRFPSLHIFGSNGNYYTQNQIKNLVNYAAEYGIMVIPEIDIPGHTTALLTAKPSLASKEGEYTLETGFGVKNPVLNPASEATYSFLSALFKEVDSLFGSPYIHIGGDEVVYTHWEENPDIETFRLKNGLNDHAALQRYFINRVSDSISLTGKNIIGWEEIHGDGLQKGAVINCWKTKNAAYNFARQGYKTILSNGYYLDLFQPLEVHYNNDPLPMDERFTDEQRKNFLGAQACLWGEFVDERILDFRLWPRMAMIAERFWSPKKRDKRELARAIPIINLQLAEHGLSHLSAPYGILYEIAGSRNIGPLIELRELVTPLKGYLRHSTGNHTVLSPLRGFADAADTDPANLDFFYKALREFIIAGNNEANFDLIAEKLFEWESFYDRNRDYFNSNPQLKSLEPLAIKLSETAKIANEAMEYIVRGKIPKQAWIDNALMVMEEAKKPIEEVELTVVEQLEKLIVFSKDHDIIIF